MERSCTAPCSHNPKSIPLSAAHTIPCVWVTHQPGTETGSIPETASRPGLPACSRRNEGILAGLGASYVALKSQNTQIWKPALSARSLLFFTAKRDQNHSGHALLIDVTSSMLPRCHSYRAVMQGAPPQPGPRTVLGEGVLLGARGHRAHGAARGWPGTCCRTPQPAGRVPQRPAQPQAEGLRLGRAAAGCGGVSKAPWCYPCAF